MSNQKGIVHILLLIILVLIALAVGVYFLGPKINLFPKGLNVISSAQPTLVVKTAYQNPFDKKTQYVNPFDQYKSPFLNLKK